MENKIDTGTSKSVVTKWIMIVGITILTVGLMLYFRYNKKPINELIGKGKDNLIAFYTQNLKPLILQTDLSNEDIFNFALYRNLPIDREENKVLEIGYDQSGEEYFEIKPAVVRENTTNYEKFVEYLGLEENEVEQLDSILNSYREDVFTDILVGDNETVAINPDLALVQKAIKLDLLTFVRNTGNKDFDKDFNLDEVREMRKNTREIIKAARDKEEDGYIFFTPDTIFARKCDVNKKDFRDKLNKMEGDIRDFEVKVDHHNNLFTYNDEDIIISEIHFEIDSHYSKVKLPRAIYLGADIEKLDSLKEYVESISLRVKTELDRYKYSFGMEILEKDSSKQFGFEFNLLGLESLLNNQFPNGVRDNASDWTEFGLKIDSLAKMNLIFSSDSVLNKDSMKFNIKKFMNKMKKNKKIKNELPPKENPPKIN